MTGSALIDLAISLAGIAILVALSRFIFGVEDAPVNARAASERLAFEEPDFLPTDWLVDEDGEAALAVNVSGELALVKRVGDALAVRRMRVKMSACRRSGAVLTLDAPDHAFRSIRIRAANEEEAQRWMLQIGGDNAI